MTADDPTRDVLHSDDPTRDGNLKAEEYEATYADGPWCGPMIEPEPAEPT